VTTAVRVRHDADRDALEAAISMLIDPRTGTRTEETT
jgi:hypothetical protein